MPKPLSFMFKDNGTVPNNPALPALVYKGALDVARDAAAALEKMFKDNGWGRDQWRDGSLALVAAKLEFAAGDVAVLPAGTGHQRLFGSEDFLVIGAYPPDGTYNLCRGDNPAERDKALGTIPKVPVPATDPVFGPEGPLPKLWRGA